MAPEYFAVRTTPGGTSPGKTDPEAGQTLLPADVDVDCYRQTHYNHQQEPGIDRTHLVPPALRRLDYPAAAFVVRPAWAHSCGCKSRRKLVMANEVKRNCMRVTECGEEAWSEAAGR